MKRRTHDRPTPLFAALLAGLVLLAAGCSPAPQPQLQALQATVAALGAQQAAMAGEMATLTAFVEYLATRPAPVITPVYAGATPTPYRPVLGAVQIEDGRCCVAGLAGEPLAINLTLSAQSPLADVTQARVAVGNRFLTEAEMEAVPWEAFAQEKQVEITVPLNWSGSYASVQFRDALGNLSAVFHDDIAVVGS